MRVCVLCIYVDVRVCVFVCVCLLCLFVVVFVWLVVVWCVRLWFVCLWFVCLFVSGLGRAVMVVAVLPRTPGRPRNRISAIAHRLIPFRFLAVLATGFPIIRTRSAIIRTRTAIIRTRSAIFRTLSAIIRTLQVSRGARDGLSYYPYP